ncbi:myomegalin [Etheostoma spectabile]|uniref:myomegalin n=1 Tax=Etheostoma spectabile TaxID=54343 RepID=UPI0013AF553C|nr:myomegalin-like [Etheostoma spectabile]
MASLADSETQRRLALERRMVERMEHEDGGTQHALTQKDRAIEELTQQNHLLVLRVEELEAHHLSSPLKSKEREAEEAESHGERQGHAHMQRLIAEQQGRLSQYEGAAGQCVGELQKAQDQVCSLQAKIRESETRNQKLQERLGEMELELRSAREEAQRQERSIQNITDTAQSKEAEAAELYQVVEEQNKMLCSLKELAHRSQLQVSGPDSVRGQGEVLALQGSLFQAQLELQAGQRAQQQASRTQEDLSRALGRLEEDLQGALQHRRDTERHNQDLQLALEKARSALQETEEQLRASEAERQRQDAEREKLVRELRAALQTKDQLMEDYCQPLEDPKEERDSLLQKLRQRIRERDRALEVNHTHTHTHTHTTYENTHIRVPILCSTLL